MAPLRQGAVSLAFPMLPGVDRWVCVGLLQHESCCCHPPSRQQQRCTRDPLSNPAVLITGVAAGAATPATTLPLARTMPQGKAGFSTLTAPLMPRLTWTAPPASLLLFFKLQLQQR